MRSSATGILTNPDAILIILEQNECNFVKFAQNMKYGFYHAADERTRPSPF